VLFACRLALLAAETLGRCLPQVVSKSVLSEQLATMKLGSNTSIKKSIIGRHCKIGDGVKIINCILLDHVTIDEK